jgi:type II secretory pathway component PulM
MIFMGNSVRAMIVWGIVAIVIMLLSYLLIVRPILNETDETIDRSFQQSQELSESIQENVNESLDEAQALQDEANQGSGGKNKGAESGGTSASELSEQIQDQVNQELEDAGVAP